MREKNNPLLAHFKKHGVFAHEDFILIQINRYRRLGRND